MRGFFALSTLRLRQAGVYGKAPPGLPPIGPGRRLPSSGFLAMGAQPCDWACFFW